MLANHFCNKFISPLGSSFGIFIGNECGGCCCLHPSSSWSEVQTVFDRLKRQDFQTLWNILTFKYWVHLLYRNQTVFISHSLYIHFTPAVKNLLLKEGDETHRVLSWIRSTESEMLRIVGFTKSGDERASMSPLHPRRALSAPYSTCTGMFETRNLHVTRLLCTSCF